MNKVLQGIFDRANQLHKHIVLPEGEDSRVVEAASQVVAMGLAEITLLGNSEEIASNNPGVNLEGVTIIDPQTYAKTADYANLLFELRKAKGMTEEKAMETILADYTMYASLMLKCGDADGVVSGACHSTANTLRPALQVIKTSKTAKIVSTFFLMLSPVENHPYCQDNCYLYGDCALIQNPTSEELAEIALASAMSAESLLGLTPRIAFLSHSSKGSAKHADIDKVTKGVEIFQQNAPQYLSDGELQFDSAVVPSVGQSKAPNSPVAGRANILVFPDLDAGNSNYKNTERLGGFQAVGPFCQGLAMPINDLSRGCKMEDIVGVVAVTALQAQSI